MNREEFVKLIEERMHKIKETFLKKNKEYAEEANIFHNFIEAGEDRDTTKEDALEGMAVKHKVAINDMVKNPDRVTEEWIDEKIGDRLLYYLLLEGMFRERIKEQERNTNYAKDRVMNVIEESGHIFYPYEDKDDACISDIKNYLLSTSSSKLPEPMKHEKMRLMKEKIKEDTGRNDPRRTHTQCGKGQEGTVCPCDKLNYMEVARNLDEKTEGAKEDAGTWCMWQASSWLRRVHNYEVQNGRQ